MGTDRKRPTTEQAEARLLADITGAKDADGGPAFPNTTFWRAGGLEEGVSTGGMSLRDYFAAAAITGMLSLPDSRVWRSDSGETLQDWRKRMLMEDAVNAYITADAMLAARNPTT